MAYLSGKPIGCGAIRKTGCEGEMEIKRMFTSMEARGKGVGKKLLIELENRARLFGSKRLVLETGDRQHEAVSLYEKFGFKRISCFGEYINSPLSVCMAKDISV